MPIPAIDEKNQEHGNTKATPCALEQDPLPKWFRERQEYIFHEDPLSYRSTSRFLRSRQSIALVTRSLALERSI